MPPSLERGVLQKVTLENYAEPITIKVSGLAKNTANRLIGTAFDGENTLPCNFSTRFATMYDEKKLSSNDIVKASAYQATKMNGEYKLMLLNLEVLEKGADAGAAPETAPTPKRPRLTADEAAQPASTPGPTPTPSEALDATTPGAAVEASPSSFTFYTPGSALRSPPAPASPKAFAQTPAAAKGAAASAPLPAAERPHMPISALNPYQNKWTIKAKIERKQEKRTANLKDGPSSVFTCVMVDEQGTQIEGTFWGEQADRFYGVLQEGKVYFISNGSVSPSNRKFSTVNNDYKITFKHVTVVEEAKNQDASKMKAVHAFVAIDCLAARISKKLPVDMLAIVTHVGALSSIKRASDGSEVIRRDITVVDKTMRSVVVTLWRDNAEKVGGALEGLTHPVLLMAKMRVTDFNGVSVSEAYSSTFEINPDVPQAVELAQWWLSEGSSLTFSPAGDGAARRGGGGRGSDEFEPLSAVMPPPDRVVLPDDKPTFHTVRCTITNINEEQSLFYLANPENFRKVVEQDGRYFCEHDGKFYDTMQRRYVMNMQIADFSGQQHINVFNDQAEQILGQPADVIGPLKETDEDAFAEALKAPRWNEWVLEIMARPKEFNGNTRMRLNVRTARPLDYALDAAKLVQAISAYMK